MKAADHAKVWREAAELLGVTARANFSDDHPQFGMISSLAALAGAVAAGYRRAAEEEAELNG